MLFAGWTVGSGDSVFRGERRASKEKGRVLQTFPLFAISKSRLPP